MSPAVPLLDSSLFTGGDIEIADNDILSAEVSNLDGAVDAALGEGGWGGEKPVGTVILHLSPDNIYVTTGQFMTRGTEDREVRWEAGKIWPEASSGVTITLRIPGFDSFRFSGGGADLGSDSGRARGAFLPRGEGGGGASPDIGKQPGEMGAGQILHQASMPPRENKQRENRPGNEVPPDVASR